MILKNSKITPTGLTLPGRKVFKAMGEAKNWAKYDDLYIQEKGYRREAIVFQEIYLVNMMLLKKDMYFRFYFTKKVHMQQF